jgi:hypothetical protein
MCRLQIEPDDTVATLRNRVALLIEEGDAPIVFRRGGRALGETERLSGEVAATASGPLRPVDYDDIADKPGDYNERLQVSEELSGKKSRHCRRVLNFHGYHVPSALIDLLMPPSAAGA